MFISVLVDMDLSLSLSDHTSLLPLWESQEGEWLTPAADGKWDHLTGAELLLGRCHFPALASQMPEWWIVVALNLNLDFFPFSNLWVLSDSYLGPLYKHCPLSPALHMFRGGVAEVR